jgi:hypothetical protein
MTMAPLPKLPDTVGELVRQRLKELGRSSTQLAEAVQVPRRYIDDLIAGHRRPPLPGRTDIYLKMTSFLRLRRNDVATCARGERAGVSPARAPAPRVRDLLLGLCAPSTAAALGRRRSARSAAELSDFFQRVLDVAQSAVLRTLDDQIAVRLAAAERGSTYVEMRGKVLEFLDVTADALTPEDLTEFLRPRIASWDVDLETGVVRVVLRTHAPRDRSPKRVAVKDVT